MGEIEGEVLPNGLLPGAGAVMRALDSERWSRAEERTAELIACIQPNQQSEERRNAVANYVQRLIMSCFPCQVSTFGSVPLKTYLPDGDIDLTAFSHDENVKAVWASKVRDILENEEKNENAEFHVKEVQYIHAEVKLIKCLVANIVVDISFNQVGGLCTLCFLDEVDNLINQNHLFKRSIILIKAWCYYESRILGAHHGLISTYALETLVLYIFHVFNNSFHGPLEVLYRFLEFFSNFDWDNFCVSLWGPVPISSLPDVTAEPPRKDSGELLLNKVFLDACSSVYAVLPGGLEIKPQLFASKHFNVIDPLRVTNNLGRSVSKGNFYRIRSAFAYGAKRLARLLDCPKNKLNFEVNQFFMNTWERHGSGHRPDAPRLSTSDSHHENSKNNPSGKILNGNFPVHKMEAEKVRGRGIFTQHGKNSPGMVATTSELPSASYRQRFKNHLVSSNSQVSDKTGKDTPSDQVVLNEVQRDLKGDRLVNESQGRFLFGRTRSSPELHDARGNTSSQVWRKRQTETKNPHDTCSLIEGIHAPSKKCVDTAESNSGSNGYQWDLGLDTLSEELSSSAALQGFNGQVHSPFNLNSAHPPFPFPPSLLASMGYSQRNLPGFLPTNIPLIDPSLSDVQFSHGLVSPQLTRYFPGIGLNSPSEDSFEQNNENFSSVEMNSREADNGLWHDQDVSSSTGCDPLDENISFQSRGKKPTAAKYVPPFRASGNAKSIQRKHTREKRGATRQNNDTFSTQDVRSSEVYTEDKTTSSRFSSATRSNSLRSRTSSEGSWDGSSVKTPKSAKEKWGKKTISSDPVTSHGKDKIMTNQTEIDDKDRGMLPNWGNEMVKKNEIAQTSGPDSMIPFAPMLIRPGSREKMDDDSELVAFYPTGPPIPFVTMLPFYNMPSETGTSDEISAKSESGRNFDHSEDTDLGGTSATESLEEKRPDILYSDFASHWQNLQFGRFCQNPRPLMHPSPVMVPPAYLQGQFPYDNPVRPLTNNVNLISQLVTNYGHRMVPVGPVQSVPSRPPSMYQQYVDDTPRYRSGTGTYWPNPKVSARERHSSANRRGYYNNHDWNENYGDRDGNWNPPKSRGALRNYNRDQTDTSNSIADLSAPSDSRSDHSWNSNSSQNGPQNVAYSMYPGGVSNGPSGPSVMMFYPLDHSNATRDSCGELLDIGPLDQVGPGTNEQSQLNDGTRTRAFEDRRYHGKPGHRYIPDLPSSPRHQRRA